MSKKIIPLFFATCLILIAGVCLNADAVEDPFIEIPFTFDHYSNNDLDWWDHGEEYSSGLTALNFSVTIGGATYDHFDMDTSGYIELLQGSFAEPTDYGYGTIDDLINNEDDGADPSSTYLLAAYDDLTTEYHGYFGYKLFEDKAVFYYDTETDYDWDERLLNNFEVILQQDGLVQWNFNYADYSGYDEDLFSGLYFGNSGTLLELTSGNIPEYKSYATPEPLSSLLFLVGGASLVGARLKRKNRK